MSTVGNEAVHTFKNIGRFMGFFQHCGLSAYCILTPKFPHSSPEAPRIIQMRETSTSEGGELLSMTFASKSVIYENSLGSFTCRNAGTWDMGHIILLPLRRKAY